MESLIAVASSTRVFQRLRFKSSTCIRPQTASTMALSYGLPTAPSEPSLIWIPHGSSDVVLNIWGFPPLGPDQGLGVVGPAPAGIEGEMPDPGTADLDQIQPAAVEGPCLVGSKVRCSAAAVSEHLLCAIGCSVATGVDRTSGTTGMQWPRRMIEAGLTVA